MKDNIDAVSARSLQVVGDVVLGALPTIEAHLSKTLVLTGRRIGARRPYKVLNASTRLRHHPKRLRRKASMITTLTEAAH